MTRWWRVNETITIPGTTTVSGLSVTSATVTLTDDDKTTTEVPDDKDIAVLSITGPGSNVAEGGDAEFTVTLSKAVAKEVTVAWSAPLNTDAAEGADLSVTSGTVTFAANSAAGATQTITITASDDALSETAEGFTVTLGDDHLYAFFAFVAEERRVLGDRDDLGVGPDHHLDFGSRLGG